MAIALFDLLKLLLPNVYGSGTNLGEAYSAREAVIKSLQMHVHGGFTNYMRIKTLKISIAITLFSILFLGTSGLVSAQRKMDRIERQTMKTMLGVIKDNVEDNYYDPNFKGRNLDEDYENSKARLEEAKTVGESLGVIAQFLMNFDDSHLSFLPPSTNIDVEYGWRMKMFGDKCFVTTVKPKSDAEKKGLKPGDQILSVEGFRPNRKEMWKINYYYNILSKRPGLNLTVLKPKAEKPIKLAIKADVDKNNAVITRQSFFQLFDEFSGKTSLDFNHVIRLGNIAIWKMPSFGLEPQNIPTIMSKFDGSSSLILDLRQNGGGLVVTLERLVGYMFDRDIKIAELKGRKEMDPQEAKTEGGSVFKGRLIVLIDSQSGSAAEIFARLIQLEERGVVLGDVSAGAVMQSRRHVNSIRNDSIIYGASITDADVIMSDGKSLEHVGVIPNALIVPTALDLANNHDPVLSKAVELLGGQLSPEEAGNLFRYEWRRDDTVVVELNK